MNEFGSPGGQEYHKKVVRNPFLTKSFQGQDNSDLLIGVRISAL